MPGAGSVTNGMNQPPQPAVSFPAAAASHHQPPQVPARAGQMDKSSLFDPARPNSDMSIMSEFSSITQCDNISVNPLLSNPLGMQPQPLNQPQQNIDIKE